MGTDLLAMLSTETERRVPQMIEGVNALVASGESDGDRVEEIRVEAHGLKGAALVVGQARLAELGEKMEIALVQRQAPGTIEQPLGGALIAGAEALLEGARAAAAGDAEPASVGAALEGLTAVE